MRFEFSGFTIDGDARQLSRGAVDVHLSPKAFDFLLLLIAARPRAVSKRDLHGRLWPDSFVSDASLTTLVGEVRAALEDTTRVRRFVRTVHRHGYAFCGTAAAIGAPGQPAPAATAGFWIMGPLRQIPLLAGENVVGRDPRVAVWLDSPSVSRRHARISIRGNCVTLEDLDSKNGTYVRGATIATPTALADGDEIRFGSVSVTFRVWAADASTRSETRS